mgnify:CR=1 FL=1
MKKLFRIISAVFSPLIVPCYALTLALCTTGLSIIPLRMRLGVIGICALIICIMPAIAVFALYRAGIVTDPGLNLRKERTLPYCITMGCYLVCAYYLYHISAPLWLIGIMIGAMLAILINLIVNLRWKISGHMAAMGGLVAVDFFITLNGLAVTAMLWTTIVTILLAGLVGTARIGLDRHTPMQVLAGTVNGFVCVYLCSWLLSLIG